MENVINLVREPQAILQTSFGHPKPWDLPGGHSALMHPENPHRDIEQGVIDLGYVSLKQLQDFAMEVEASDTDVSSRMLATNTFRRPLREVLFAESDWGNLSTEHAIIEDPERGKLLSIDFLSSALKTGRLTEKRPPLHGTRDRPPILGPKTVKLLQDYIDSRKSTSR